MTQLRLPTALVLELLNYAPETGIFLWRERPLGMFATQRHCSIWNANYAYKVAGTVNHRGYRVITINCRHYAAHRLAWVIVFGEWPSRGLDHINGDLDDNRIANLRLASQAENLQNQGLRSDSTTGHIGVSWDRKAQRFQAYITINYRKKHLGYFERAEQASAAYLAAKQELHTFNPILR
jgi:hypothetical protein